MTRGDGEWTGHMAKLYKWISGWVPSLISVWKCPNSSMPLSLLWMNSPRSKQFLQLCNSEWSGGQRAVAQGIQEVVGERIKCQSQNLKCFPELMFSVHKKHSNNFLKPPSWILYLARILSKAEHYQSNARKRRHELSLHTDRASHTGLSLERPSPKPSRVSAHQETHKVASGQKPVCPERTTFWDWRRNKTTKTST